MLICSLLAWLALLALLLMVLVFSAGRMLSAVWLERYARSICPALCRVAVVLAFITGFALAWWLFACAPTLWRALAAVDIYVRWLVLLLFLLVVVLAWLLTAIAACRTQLGILKLSISPIAAWSALVLLALLLLAIVFLVLRCCNEPLGVLLFGDPCTQSFTWIVLLFLLALLLWMVSQRYCREPSQSVCQYIPWYLGLTVLLSTIILLLLLRSCSELARKDHDLAMIGIWWEGQFSDEAGAHLRWAFRSALEFPAGGFDLFRRPSSGGAWTKLNAQPIYPVNAFSDASPAPGPMWQRRVVDRLHPSRWSHFEGAPFTGLQDMLGRTAYSMLFFVQAPDDPTVPQPTSPYDSQADLDSYLRTYYAYYEHERPDEPAAPLAQWRIRPIEALMIAAIDPEIARMLGLLYVDRTADPNIEYDYRIVGHWSDRDRSWIVARLSRPNTQPLAPPILTRATTPVTYTTPGGGSARLDRAVALRWDPPVLDPGAPVPSSAGITAVRVLPKREDLGVRPCAAAAPPDAGFAVIMRLTQQGSQPVAAIVPVPEEKPTGPVWPDYFFIDRHLDYRCYAYGLEGIDLFGRTSVLSNTLIADVIDITGPPPPLNIAATAYQRADQATLNGLTPAFRDRLFPPDSIHQTALHVSWVWPNRRRATVPDLDHFRIYVKIRDYETFSRPESRALWSEAINWGPFSPEVVPAIAGGELPANLAAAGVTDAEYFDTLILDPPMTPDDDKPVVFGYVGVGSVDRSPFSNVGNVSPPTVIFARDFDPPLAPPIPTVDKEPESTDKGANASLALSWSGDSRHLYHLVRAKGSELDALPLSEPIPACLTADTPTCTDSTPTCIEEHRRFSLRRKAIAHPQSYRLASLEPSPGVPVGGSYRFQYADKVDASEGNDYLYAGRAMDAAGNIGPIGCAQLVHVTDFLPPRAPTVRSIKGIEGAIRIDWATNPEADLEAYRLLRTMVPENDGSLERMTLVLEVNRDGTVRAPAAALAPTRQGGGTAYESLQWDDTTVRAVTDYRYRLVAIDRSGNISALSASARGRSVDTTPPAPPVWGSPHVVWETLGSIRLRFAAPPGDADATFRLQRRDAGSILWRPIGGWLPRGTTDYVDTSVTTGTSYTYRIQAMDPAGNVGVFSSEEAPR